MRKDDDTLAIGSTIDGGLDGATPAAPLESGTGALRESRYELGEQIARGGMGRIVAATDRQFDRPVAIKELLPKYRDELRDRFRREALVTGRLQHPSIVPVYELGTRASGEPFYAMKHVEGKPFDEVIAETRTLDDRLALMPNVIAVAEAVAYAHSRRVIHRDLKPQNVLIGDYGETVVIDWGLAKPLDGDDSDLDSLPPALADDGIHTVAGSVMGTPAYMPREQAKGDPVDERADVYSLGAILYHVLAGQAPVRGESTPEILRKVTEEEPTPLSKCAPSVPADLTSIVARAMALDPEDRYASAAELATDLRRFRRGQLVLSHEYSTLALVARWLSRHRAAASIAAVAVVVVASLGTWAIIATRNERDTAIRAQVALLQSRGRAELLDDKPDRALAYLSRAYDRAVETGDANPVLLSLIADAARRVEPVVATLTGHSAEITSVDLSRDAAKVVTSSNDGTIRLWSASTGDSIHTFELGVPVLEARFAWDNQRIIGFGAGKAAIWRPDGSVQSQIDYDAGELEWVEMSGDEDRWIVVSKSAAVVYDLRGKVVSDLVGHEHGLLFGSLNADGSLAVTCGQDRKARVFDATTGDLLHQIEAGLWADDEPNMVVNSCLFRPGQDHIATATGKSRVKIYNATNGQEVARFEALNGSSTAPKTLFSRDGDRMIAFESLADPVVWDPDTGKYVTTLFGNIGTTVAAQFSESGTRIVAGGSDGIVKVWDAETGELVASVFAHRQGVRHLAAGNEGSVVVSVGEHEWSAVVTRPARGSIARVLPARPSETISHIEVDRDEKTLLVQARFAHYLWDLETGERTVIDVPGNWLEGAVRMSPDGKLVAGGGRSGVAEVVTRDAKPVCRFEAGGDRSAVFDLAFSPAGTEIATAHADGIVRVWGARSCALRAKLAAPASHGRVRDVEFSPDGSLLATGAEDGTAMLFDPADGGVRAELGGTKRPVEHVRFSPDATQLATADEGGTVAVWKTATGELAASAVYGARPFDLAFSPDGTQLAAGTDHSTAQIWQVDGLLPLARLDANDTIMRVRFSPDGTRLATTDTAGEVSLWEASTGERLWTRGVAYTMIGGPFLDGGRQLVTASHHVLWVWNVGPETRSPAQIRQIVADKVPWTFDRDGRIVPRAMGTDGRR